MTEEREIEMVAGVLEGVTQKKPDTWQVGVKPDGSNYSKNLWTKDAELVQALGAKLGQSVAFVCSASYWENASGTQIRSLWINKEGTGSDSPATRATPDTPRRAEAQKGAEGLSKEEWARKDRAADLRASIAISASGITRDPGQPINKWVEDVLFAARQFHNVVQAERSGEDVPFLSAHDESVPF